MGYQIRSFRTLVRGCVVASVVAFLVAGCGQSKTAAVGDGGALSPNFKAPLDWQPLDVSDVAYLWPNMGGQRFNRLLPVVDGQQRGEDLIPSRGMLRDLLAFSQGRSVVQATNFSLFNPQLGRQELVSTPSDSWQGIGLRGIRVISFRVENCGDGIGDHSGFQTIDKWVAGQGPRASLQFASREACLPMLRLVAQPRQGDNTVHLIYQYQDAQVMTEMMKDMQFLKKTSPRPTDGVPLGVHPGLAAENGVGSFSEQVKFFVKKYARPDRLIKIAVMATNQAQGGGQWNFFEAKITNNSSQNFQWEMNPLLSLRGNPISQGFTVPESIPARQGAFEIANAGNEPLRPGVLEATMDPRLTTASNLDCKSCHVSSSLAANMASTRPNQFDRFFAFPESVYDVPGVTSVPDSRVLPTRDNNMRAFGWFQGPTVSVRTAKKAGAVAASMNHTYFGRSAGNGFNCSGQQHRLLKCILSNAGQNSNCMQRFCR